MYWSSCTARDSRKHAASRPRVSAGIGSRIPTDTKCCPWSRPSCKMVQLPQFTQRLPTCSQSSLVDLLYQLQCKCCENSCQLGRFECRFFRNFLEFGSHMLSLHIWLNLQMRKPWLQRARFPVVASFSSVLFSIYPYGFALSPRTSSCDTHGSRGIAFPGSSCPSVDLLVP